MLVLGALLGCATQAATVVACLASRSPFVVAPVYERSQALDVKRKLAGRHMSDHCVLIGAYDEWDKFLSHLNVLRSETRTVAFTNGCFDILHSGHITYLKETKELADILVVGINADESVKHLKGRFNKSCTRSR